MAGRKACIERLAFLVYEKNLINKKRRAARRKYNRLCGTPEAQVYLNLYHKMAAKRKSKTKAISKLRKKLNVSLYWNESGGVDRLLVGRDKPPQWGWCAMEIIDLQEINEMALNYITEITLLGGR